jgi:hypothetical protein
MDRFRHTYLCLYRNPGAGNLVFALALVLGCGPGERDPGPCRELGWCPPDAPCFDARCADPAARCQRGREARLYGRSAALEGTCRATDPEACAAAEITCRVWGQCSPAPASFAPAPGTCPAGPDDRDWLASTEPACAGRGTCVALSDPECRAARVCAESGRCVAQAGVCVAGADADCSASSGCTVSGACSRDPARGRCGAASPAHCQASERCPAFGECGLGRGRCVACEESEECTRLGLCGIGHDRCVAKSDEACGRSVACRQDGSCRAAGGRCVR